MRWLLSLWLKWGGLIKKYMKATELRIGNYYLMETLDPNNASNIIKVAVKVIASTISDAARYKEDWNGEPIPLTPEWLERFGFKEVDGYWYKGFFALRNGEYFEIIDIWIDHVHQLQNLYYALTGEELTVKD